MCPSQCWLDILFSAHAHRSYYLFHDRLVRRDPALAVMSPSITLQLLRQSFAAREPDSRQNETEDGCEVRVHKTNLKELEAVDVPSHISGDKATQFAIII
ncbi:hypothetical protein RRG08_028917 [Elysia crispata]|uniref:Uncharacterized protein n=1 Tax=Elysia crispata TaxID=231223 RepID=A0AAE1APY0_9GAST|nr:hypothetical protein RRG08_028917 [Elysia crispata]